MLRSEKVGLVLTAVTAAAAVGVAGCLVGELSLAAVADTTITGPVERDSGFGRIVRGLGDVSGDGIPDFAVSAHRSSGRVYVFFGPVRDAALDVARANAVFTGAAGSEAGWSFTSGDLTRDGIRDLVIGAPEADGGRGRVYVIPGGAGLRGALGPASARYSFVGESAGEWAGWDVSVGDYDGDGRQDLAVAAPNRNSGSARLDAKGVVYVLYGPNAVPPAGTELRFTANAHARLECYDAGDCFLGSSLASINLDGDRDDELVAGAHMYDAPLERGAEIVNAGAAFIVHGGARILGGQDVTRLANVASLVGSNRYANAGYAVANVGDVDADGLPDLAVSEPYANHLDHGVPCDPATGHAFVGVVFGRRAGAADLRGQRVLFATAEVQLRGTACGEGWFARDLGAAGDLNSDGAADFLVGTRAGHAFVLYGYNRRSTIAGEHDLYGAPGSDPALAFVGRLTGAAGEVAGYSVSGIGDQNRDGFADLVLTAPRLTDVYRSLPAGQSGRAYLVFGEHADPVRR